MKYFSKFARILQLLIFKVSLIKFQQIWKLGSKKKKKKKWNSAKSIAVLKVNKPMCKQTHMTWWGSAPFWAQKRSKDVFHGVRHYTEGLLSVINFKKKYGYQYSCQYSMEFAMQNLMTKVDQAGGFLSTSKNHTG